MFYKVFVSICVHSWINFLRIVDTVHFLSAVSFLTIVYLPKSSPWGDGRMILYFPLVGILIGGMLCGADFLFGFFFDGEVRALLDVLFLAVISGGLHLDGLADAADGLLSHRGKEEALEIMRDQRVGAMGALALIFFILMKYEGIAALTEDGRWIWLLAAPALARSAQVAGLVFLDYARKEGGIATNLFQKNKYHLLIFAPLPMVFPFLSGMKIGLITVALFILCTVLLLFLFQRKIEGMTGDTIGALSEIVEAFFLVIGGIMA